MNARSEAAILRVVRRDGQAAQWLELTKPKIAFFVLMAALVGALLGGGLGSTLWPAVLASLWIGCNAIAAGIFNQVLERDTDALMERTVGRPLVTGRIAVRDAVLAGTALLAIGTAGLALGFNLLSALFALTSFVLYTLVYTPLKRTSSFNTVVGAIPGAMPPLIGYVALAGQTGLWAWALFLIVFAWQFPHFLAIAWLYRADYGRAGLKMLPALPDSAGLAGRQSLVYGLFLLPISLWPVVNGAAGPLYALGALVLGLVYLGCAARFARQENVARARALLFSSLVYLPFVLSFVLVDRAVFGFGLHS